MKNTLINRTAVFLLTALIFTAASVAFAQSDKDIQTVANSLVNKLTKAMESKNYKAYMDPWIPDVKGSMTKEKFESICDGTLAQMGTLKSKTFYNIVPKDGYLVIQWKARFSKISEDLYLQLVLKKEGKKFLVAGHWIKPKPFENK